MKLVEGIVYTRDMKKLAAALESMGLIVHELAYESRRVVHYGVNQGTACIYNLLNRVKIRTIISDEGLGTMLEALRSFGDCKFVIIQEKDFCTA